MAKIVYQGKLTKELLEEFLKDLKKAKIDRSTWSAVSYDEETLNKVDDAMKKALDKNDDKH